MTFCAERFFHIMRGYADDFVSAQNGTHIAGFHIILPDMHPVRVNLFRKRHVVVNHKRHAVPPAHCLDLQRLRTECFPGQLFFP